MSTILSIELTDDDVRYVCSLIPKDIAISYFQRHEKKFHRLKPGFRSAGLNQSQVEDILFSGALKNDDFIVYLLETQLRFWLIEISKCIDNYKQQGKDDIESKLLTLSESFFVGNPAIYFKFMQENHSEDYIIVFANAINLMKKSCQRLVNFEKERDKALAMSNEQNSKKKKLKESVIDLQSELVDVRNAGKANMQRYTLEIASKEQELVKMQTKLMKADNSVLAFGKEIETLQLSIKEARVHSSDFQEHVDVIIAERDRYKADYDYLYNEMGIAEARKEVVVTIDSSEGVQFSTPKHPIDIEEFAEFLRYNLEDFGIKEPLLVSHLCKVLFIGEPLIIDRTCCNNLIDCITNTLLNGENHNVLQYREAITVQEIEAFLNSEGRVVCLDGFIGNYNEMLLIPIFQRYKSKIIFLSICYDETLKYVSECFLCYVRYININHFVGLKQYPTSREDPSKLEELEYTPKDAIRSDRNARILSTIMNELDFSVKYANKRSSEVDCEETLNGILAFEILPYVIDVLRRNPFTMSEKLLKFAESDRFNYKSLFKGLFNL